MRQQSFSGTFTIYKLCGIFLSPSPHFALSLKWPVGELLLAGVLVKWCLEGLIDWLNTGRALSTWATWRLLCFRNLTRTLIINHYSTNENTDKYRLGKPQSMLIEKQKAEHFILIQISVLHTTIVSRDEHYFGQLIKTFSIHCNKNYAT